MSYPDASGVPTLVWRDATVGNSKSLIIPAPLTYTLLHGSVGLISNATVGNRRIQFAIYDTDGITLLWYWQNGGTAQAASLTYNYPLLPGAGPKDVSNQSGYNINIPPKIILYPGWKITASEINNLSATDILIPCLFFATIPLI